MTETTPKLTEVPQAPTPEQSRVVAAGVIREAVGGGIMGDYVGCPLPPKLVAKPNNPSPHSDCPRLNTP